MHIRPIRSDDAAQFLRLQLQLDQETQFMLFEPGERKTTVEEKRAQIERELSEGVSTILVAEQDGQLVGYIQATGYRRKRAQHAFVINGRYVDEYHMAKLLDSA